MGPGRRNPRRVFDSTHAGLVAPRHLEFTKHAPAAGSSPPVPCLAIDFDPERNALKASNKTARLARPDCVEFWKIWESEGWVSLGRTRNFDWMHVQAARL